MRPWRSVLAIPTRIRSAALLAALSCSLACRIGNTDLVAPGPDQCLAANRDLELVHATPAPGRTGALILSRGTSREHRAEIQIFAADGRLVDESDITHDDGQLRLSPLDSGTYTIVVDVDGHRATDKFVIVAGQQSRMFILASRPLPTHPSDEPPLLAGVLFRYRNWGCHGACPNYRVTVFNDGRVHWYGRFHVRARGPRVARLSPRALAALRGWLACLAPLPREYDGYSHDLPVVLQFRRGKQQYQFDVAWRTATSFTLKLVAAIEHTLAVERWTEPPHRR